MSVANNEQTTQHTPGPWASKGGLWVGNRYGEMVADCVTEQNSQISNTERAANAQLIAAAPDLLAAAKAALTVLQQNAMGNGNAAGLLEAAIAKAQQ